ncbi:MAG TPA: transketolase C-terminal domain-containing protein, partial [Acidimicrobiales bacterium]|nr:transketolase C-terminal domain-containing protein [Acidimicrobiales bacterium]
IDLRTIQPWDKSLVASSVARTGRLVTVEENQYTGGWGTEIVAEIAASCHGALRAPPTRVTAPDVPVPYGTRLEERFVPSAEYVIEQVSGLLETGAVPSPWWEGAL